MFCKKGVLRNVTKFTGKHLCQSLFFNKLQTQGLQPYSTRYSRTGIFLWILWNFKEHLFYRTPLVAASSFIFSIKLFLLNTPMMNDWLTDMAGIHAFTSDIPSQIHPSPVTLWQVILILFVLSTQEIKFWLIHWTNSTLVFHQNCLIHKDVPHFDSLILSNTFLCNFLLVLVGSTCIHVFCYLFSTSKIGLIWFCIFKSNILVLLQKFCLLVFI